MTMKGHEVYKKLLEQYAEAYRAWIDTGEKEYLHRCHPGYRTRFTQNGIQ